MQHGTAPDDRRVVGDEVAHRQAADPVGRGGHHQVPDDQRIVVHPEHPRYREPVDVGVEDADVVAHAGQGDGQVDRDRGLAHAALARGDPEDPGLRAWLHEPVGPALFVSELAAVGMIVAVVPAGGGTAVHRSTPQQHAEAGPPLLIHDRVGDGHVVGSRPTGPPLRSPGGPAPRPGGSGPPAGPAPRPPSCA